MNDSTQRKANLGSAYSGVRWQALMEDHLETMRALSTEAMLHGIAPEQASVRAQLAQAHATAALTLSIANAGSDLEGALSRVATELES